MSNEMVSHPAPSRDVSKGQVAQTCAGLSHDGTHTQVPLMRILIILKLVWYSFIGDRMNATLDRISSMVCTGGYGVYCE